MTLAPASFEKIQTFMRKLVDDVYPEPVAEPHLSITRQMVERMFTHYGLQTGARVLDVGCGQGLALEQFLARGADAEGITLGDEDVAECQRRGFKVQSMDQSSLEYPDQVFDTLWCRHCLEHSIFPYFTLSEFHRVLKPGGLLYVEVPAPDTSCAHQQNPNHYSVLGKSMWLQLMHRSGFVVVEQLDINFEVPAGPDTYWVFVLRKPAHA